MKWNLSSRLLLHQALVMPARVGKSVGAVRCLAEAWVWPDVLALRGSGHIREGKAMRHNDTNVYEGCD